MKICTSVLTLAFILSVSAPVFAGHGGDGTGEPSDTDEGPQQLRVESEDDRDERIKGSRAR